MTHETVTTLRDRGSKRAVLLGGGVAVVGTYTRAKWLANLLLSLPPLGISLPLF